MDPYWVAFDMDQTLGCFDLVHPFLTVFFPDVLQQVYRAPYYDGKKQPKLDISPKEKKSLADAFQVFVKWMAVKEEKNKLLRPGIIQILQLLLKAKKQGLVGGLIIYSNNSNPYMLHFCHELIRCIIGAKEPVFCQLLHWWHPLRNAEVRNPSVVRLLGHGPKTVETIQRAFKMYPCAAASVPSSHILFFDDLIHKQISDVIPAQNYFHVQPYNRYDADLSEIYECFLTALMVENLDMNERLIKEYERIGLYIGIDKSNIASFAYKGDGKSIHVFDSELLFKRLAKLLRMDAQYNSLDYRRNIEVVYPSKRPFNVPTRTLRLAKAVVPTSTFAFKRGGRKTRKIKKRVA